MTETCPICGSDVPFGATVHVLVHTKTEAGVVDHYVCERCYENDLRPLLEAQQEADA